ncbi:MAG TPA: hypothetical protein VKA38_09515 [Draconibacterium sp.]|nr:hypothetical protein [Draconibacterium sp.]
MKKLVYMAVVALIAAAGIFWSCQKEEVLNNPENGLMLKGAKNKMEVTAELVVSPNTTVCLNTPVTITAKAWNDENIVSGGKIQIEELIDGNWVQVVNYIDLPHFAEYSFTPEEVGSRVFRAHYVGGSDFTNSDDEKTLTFEECGCQFEGNLLSGEAISCDNTREAVYTFSSQMGVNSFKIQGGLTNFTGENAIVYVNNKLVVFDETSDDDWAQGTTDDGYVVAQRTPGNSSNRNIRVEGSLEECSDIIIRIIWNSTNSGGVITGEWSVSGEDIGDVSVVPGLACTQ